MVKTLLYLSFVVEQIFSKCGWSFRWWLFYSLWIPARFRRLVQFSDENQRSGGFYLTTGDCLLSEGHSVAATNDGGCMLCGYVSDSAMYGGSALLMRLNANGDSLWTKKYFRSPTLDAFQEACAYIILPLSSGQFLMFSDRNSGSTEPQATLVKLDASGDTLWSQVGYPYYMLMSGIDPEGGILLTGSEYGEIIRTTVDGLYVSPQLTNPGNFSTGVALNPTLEWSAGNISQFVSSFHVQVASDTLFTNVVWDSSNVLSEMVQTKKLLSNTKYFWRVQSIGTEGGSTQWSPIAEFTTQNATAVKKTDSNIPTTFSLDQNYPNPFNPTTAINYALPFSSSVKIEVYNVLGENVTELLNAQKTAGYYSVNFNTTGLASGVYLYMISAKSLDGKSEYRDTKKMVLLK